MVMMQLRARVSMLCALIAVGLIATTLPLHAVVPTAPSNLTFTVSGQVVVLNWTASANSPSQYIIQAGFAPGQTALSVPVSAATTSFTASAGAGTYFVRVVASNGDGSSAPSNEVTIVVTSGCGAPSAPQNLRAMIKGTELFLHWRGPASGGQSGFAVQAGAAAGQTFAQFNTPGTTLNSTVGSGTYFVRVIAQSPCGNSASSNEITISFPSNTVREPDPAPGTFLGIPDVQALVQRINAAFPATIANSCPTGRKYEPNPWLNNMVDQLRTYSTRFGYNAKPTRTSVDNNGFPVIAAGDEITYFVGSGIAEGSSAVVAIDILFNHCGVTNPSLDYRNIAPEPAIWTGAGRFAGDEFPEGSR
jgi:hypothetical protein